MRIQLVQFNNRKKAFEVRIRNRVFVYPYPRLEDTPRRRLGTSATQFYRLLDQTNTRTSIGQLLSLLHILDCDVDLVVKKRKSA